MLKWYELKEEKCMDLETIINRTSNINNNSAKILNEIKQYIVGGASSSMRVVPYHMPLVVEKTEGPYVWDADDNELIDYNMGYGPLIFGHRSSIVNEAIKLELDKKGAVIGFPTTLYCDAGELICDAYPSIERLRFSSSGTEVDQTAIRLARDYTGRTEIILFEGHYHGSSDSVFHKYTASPEDLNQEGDYTAKPGTKGMGGAPYNAYVLPWNNVQVLESFLSEHGNNIAAMIMEPVMGNGGIIEPKDGYLIKVRELCTKYGIVLIFDEVITGCRVARGGAQERYGVKSDLTTLSKATIGGFPGSIIGGKKEIMELLCQDVFHGGVYSGNPLTVAVTLATQRELKKNGTEIYNTLERRSNLLVNGIREIFKENDIPVVVQNAGAMIGLFFVDEGIREINDYRDFCLKSDKVKYIVFQHKMQQKGVYIHPNNLEPWYLSTVHTDEVIYKTLDIMRATVKELKDEKLF